MESTPGPTPAPKAEPTPPPKEGGHSYSTRDVLTIMGIVAVVVGAFIRIEFRVNQLEPAKIRELQAAAIREVKAATPASIELPVGTVIASILKPTKFKETYGDSWVLADGRNITGSKLSAAIQRDSIPDFGGQFIRGINTREQAEQDPDGVREPGHRQADAMADHTHNYMDIYF